MYWNKLRHIHVIRLFTLLVIKPNKGLTFKALAFESLYLYGDQFAFSIQLILHPVHAGPWPGF